MITYLECDKNIANLDPNYFPDLDFWKLQEISSPSECLPINLCLLTENRYLNFVERSEKLTMKRGEKVSSEVQGDDRVAKVEEGLGTDE